MKRIIDTTYEEIGITILVILLGILAGLAVFTFAVGINDMLSNTHYSELEGSEGRNFERFIKNNCGDSGIQLLKGTTSPDGYVHGAWYCSAGYEIIWK